jgi:hypothetical protein
MFQQLKESAAAAGGSVRENMGKASNSVRGGLGLPPGGADSNNNADDEEQSVASSFIDEASEYCPQMSYQQVRLIDIYTCFEFVFRFHFRHIVVCLLFVYLLVFPSLFTIQHNINSSLESDGICNLFHCRLSDELHVTSAHL